MASEVVLVFDGILNSDGHDSTGSAARHFAGAGAGCLRPLSLLNQAKHAFPMAPGLTMPSPRPTICRARNARTRLSAAGERPAS